MSEFSIITVGRTPIGRARSPWRRPFLKQPRHVLALLVAAPLLAGAVAAIALGWRDMPPARIHTPGEALIAGGRITGLLGAYLLLVEVVLMARIPWLERRIGSDWLARAHRELGTYLVAMLVTHALLLVGVGALSGRAVRRRLPYEAWHFTHLYAYLAVALGFTHQLAVGADLRPRAARLAWTAAHLVVLACVLRYRVAQPVVLALRHRLRVHRVVQEADRVVSIYVSGRGLERLRPGVRVVAEGPYGALTGAQRTRRRVLLIAGGIGITPMRALLEGLPGGPGDISLVYRGDLTGARVFARELASLAARRGVLVHYLLGPRAECCPCP